MAIRNFYRDDTRPPVALALRDDRGKIESSMPKRPPLWAPGAYWVRRPITRRPPQNFSSRKLLTFAAFGSKRLSTRESST
jgi:hypothetical protein